MHIILADDHTLIRETLSIYLERLGENVEVRQAANFDDAYKFILEGPEPGLVILDLLMPGMEEFRGLKIMHENHPNIPVVILSAVVDAHQAQRSLRLGAYGYIPKTIRGPALIAALTQVLEGETYIPASLLNDAEQESPLGNLTHREREVLTLLTKGHSNKEIAARLGIKEITVKVHLKAVFRKFEVANRTQAVRKALELGISGAP